MKKANKIAILPVVLYVIAAIIAAYSIFTIYTSYTYVSELIELGSITINDQLTDIINYYVSASMPYVFYTIVVWAIGYIINKLNSLNTSIININKEANRLEEITEDVQQEESIELEILEKEDTIDDEKVD